MLAALCYGAWWLSPFSGGGVTVTGLAFEAKPYVMFGLVPSFTREGQPLRSSNALGYRGAELQQPKPEGRTRVVCLGGSTTYGFRVADSEAWPAVLGRLLSAARPELDIEVVNAGVESYTSAESLARLAFDVLELKPDLLVLHHAANDVRPRRYPGFEPGYGHFRKVWNGSPEGYAPTGGELSGINFFIQQAPDPAADAAEPGDVLSRLERAGTGSFRRNLISMLGVAAAHDVPLVLTTMPYDPASIGSDPGLGPGIDQHNDVLRALAAERDVPLVDLATLFGGGGFVDPIHLDPKGSRRKARLLVEPLAALLP